MMLLVRRSSTLTFAALLAVAGFTVPCAEAGSIDVSFESVVTVDKSRTALASLSIDGEESDLFEMTSLFLPAMTGGGDGEEVDETIIYTKIEATSRLVQGGIVIVWKGSISETGRFGFATLIQHSNGNVAGIFSTETSAFKLSTMPDGTMQLKETFWEDALENEEIEMSTPEYDLIGSEEYVDSAMVVDIPKSAAVYKSSRGNGLTVSGGANRILRDGNRDLQDLINIDVLILITNRALCESAELAVNCTLTDESKAPIEEMLKVVEEQTNEAMQGVGVRTSITFVRLIYIDAGFDGRPSVESLEVLRTSPNIATWRSQSGADLVAMVTGNDPDGRIGGMAYLNSPQSVSSFSSIQFYTMTHEIMHCIGANHNPENSGTQHPYAHGFQVPGVLRTYVRELTSKSKHLLKLPFFDAHHSPILFPRLSRIFQSNELQLSRRQQMSADSVSERRWSELQQRYNWR